MHPDSTNLDYDDPYNERIVHIPLKHEGQWLRIGKEVLKKNDEVENFIHKITNILFESSAILPITQLYGGHYEILANTRFHCITSAKKNYVGSHLFLKNVYLIASYEAKNSSDILAQ